MSAWSEWLNRHERIRPVVSDDLGHCHCVCGNKGFLVMTAGTIILFVAVVLVMVLACKSW